MVLFVGFAESFCLLVCLKMLLLLVIVVVDICYWLHPVVNRVEDPISMDCIRVFIQHLALLNTQYVEQAKMKI